MLLLDQKKGDRSINLVFSCIINEYSSGLRYSVIESVLAAVPVVSRWAKDVFGATKDINTIKRKIDRYFPGILIPDNKSAIVNLKISVRKI